MARVIAFSKKYFTNGPYGPLTGLMINTLRRACNQQKKGAVFGPKDIKGSMSSLIRRGLIITHTIQQNGQFQLTWFVTPEAVSMLEKIEAKIKVDLLFKDYALSSCKQKNNKLRRKRGTSLSLTPVWTS